MESGLNSIIEKKSPHKNDKFPFGMIIIIFLIGLSILSSLLGIKQTILIFGPFYIKGLPIIVYNLLVLFISVSIIYGIIKRKFWARILIIIWYLYSILHPILNFMFFNVNKEYYLESLRKNIPEEMNYVLNENIVFLSQTTVMFVALTIGLAIIFYIRRKKEFFKK